MSRRKRWSWLIAGLAACGPVAEEAGPVGERSQAIIYGVDDRQEVYEHPDPMLRQIAASSLVALIPRARFGRGEMGDFAIFTPRLVDAFRVCEDQRFALQPTAADCTGVLIDDDLVLTAGHCLASDGACDRFAFVFDYFYDSPDELEAINWGDIYGCRRVVQRSVSADAGTRIDYAIVQLERAPLGRRPVPVRSQPLSEGEPLATIGCASGLPAKVDSGSRVLSLRAPNADFFLLDSDTFAGSSGSGVFDAAGQLVGVLVRGGEDYEPRPDAGCVVPKVVDLAGPAPPASLGEEATYVARAVDGLCASGWPSQRLCGPGAAPRCGDGFCTAGETRSSCPEDCDCVGADCAGGPIDVAALAGPAIPKSRDAAGGCAVAPGRTSRTALSSVLAAVLVSWRRRRRRADQPPS